MKRLIAAAVLIAIIVIICIVSSKTTLAAVKAASDTISRCERLFNSGKYGEAQKAVNEFKESWKTQSRIISLFSNHCKLDDINMLSAILPDAVKHKNSYEFNSSVNKIRFALDTIYTEHSLSIKNLY